MQNRSLIFMRSAACFEGFMLQLSQEQECNTAKKVHSICTVCALLLAIHRPDINVLLRSINLQF